MKHRGTRINQINQDKIGCNKAFRYRNKNVIVTTFSSLAATEVAILTTSDAANDENFVKMTFIFPWMLTAINRVSQDLVTVQKPETPDKHSWLTSTKEAQGIKDNGVRTKQLHFRKKVWMKLLYLDSICIDIWSVGCNWQWIRIDSGNGLVPSSSSQWLEAMWSSIPIPCGVIRLQCIKGTIDIRAYTHRAFEIMQIVINPTIYV